MISPILFDDSDSSSSDSSFPISDNSSISPNSSILSLQSVSSMSDSSRSSRSQAANSASGISTSSTEEYEIPRLLQNNRQNNNNPIIDISDTQAPILAAAGHDDDDDVVLVPQHIETIDLCATQVPFVPINLNNEIIDITDSPGQRVSPVRVARRASRRLNNRVSPYTAQEVPAVGPSTSTNKKTSTPKPKLPNVDLDDTFTQGSTIKYACPICLESVKNREPVTTMCGHVFCKQCIKAALIQTAKKCPMCKKTLNAKNPFIQLFL